MGMEGERKNVRPRARVSIKVLETYVGIKLKNENAGVE